LLFVPRSHPKPLELKHSSLYNFYDEAKFNIKAYYYLKLAFIVQWIYYQLQKAILASKNGNSSRLKC
jgi:hypothetical protein